VLEGRNARCGEVLPHRLDVVGRGGGERDRLLGVESLLAHRLGCRLAERCEVGEGLLEPALDTRAGVEMVVGHERPEVVGGQCDEHGIDELPGSAGAIEGCTGVSR
jgi:hypothetical protein